MAGSTYFAAAEAEAGFLIDALQRGWLVAKPIQDGLPFDFLVQMNSSVAWVRVQVKKAYHDKGKLCLSLRRCNEKGNRPYRDGDFEFLYARWDGHRKWLIPWSKIADKRSVIVLGGSKYAQWAL